jgi:hypothetical protein
MGGSTVDGEYRNLIFENFGVWSIHREYLKTVVYGSPTEII